MLSLSSSFSLSLLLSYHHDHYVAFLNSLSKDSIIYKRNITTAYPPSHHHHHTLYVARPPTPHYHDNQTLIMRPHDHIKHITHLTSTGRIHKPILGTKHDLDENSVIIYIYMYIHKTFTMKEGTIYIYISFFCN